MISKAIIPIAGKGTRIGPICTAVPKAMLPLVNVQTERIDPVLYHILVAAGQASITEVGLVISPWQKYPIQRYLDAIRGTDLLCLPNRISFIVQEQPLGFGDAVLRGKKFIGDEPFMVLLGDHVYARKKGTEACTLQVSRAFVACSGDAVVGVQATRIAEVDRTGVVRGKLLAERIYRCSGFIEKPSPEAARQQLVTKGLEADTFLAHCGIYIFTPEIFECLSEVADRQAGKEIELADAQSILLQRHPGTYWLRHIEGTAYDVGSPEGYIYALKEFRSG